MTEYIITTNINYQKTTYSDTFISGCFWYFDKRIIFEENNEHGKDQYSPSLKQLIHYQVQKILAEKVLEKDLKYWDKKGWLEKSFYYDCQINIFKKLIANLFYKFLRNKIEY